MFRHAISIGRVFGISIDLDWSWFLIAVLIAWSLAVGYYPVEFPGWSGGEYWLIGALTAIMLFVSVLIHELGHSLVANHLGVKVPRITLFVFGGVSQMSGEPPSAADEFWISVVGPLVSFALAALFWELEPLLAFNAQLYALDEYLALINVILGIFNLIPGFPLDGGRVFRAILWRVTGKYQRATSIAAFTGRIIGFLMIFAGVWQLLSGNFINGLWIAFIGWFLESAAGAQLQQEALKGLLGDRRVYDAMKRDFPHVPSELTLQELVDGHILATSQVYYIVTHADVPAGLVTLGMIREIPRARWVNTTVSQVMVPMEKLDTIRPDEQLWAALEKMGRDGVNQLPVIDKSGVVGVVSRQDILQYLNVVRAFSA